MKRYQYQYKSSFNVVLKKVKPFFFFFRGYWSCIWLHSLPVYVCIFEKDCTGILATEKMRRCQALENLTYSSYDGKFFGEGSNWVRRKVVIVHQKRKVNIMRIVFALFQ